MRFTSIRKHSQTILSLNNIPKAYLHYGELESMGSGKRIYMCMYVTLLLLWHAVHLAVDSLSKLVNNVQLKYNLPIEKIATIFAFQIVAFRVFFFITCCQEYTGWFTIKHFYTRFTLPPKYNFILLFTTYCIQQYAHYQNLYICLLKYRNFSSAKF